MALETKDKPGHIQDDDWRPRGLSKDEARDMEAQAVSGADQDRATASQREIDQLRDITGIDAKEEKAMEDRAAQKDTSNNDDRVGQGFSNNKSSRFKNLKINLPKQARNKIAIGLASATIAGAVAIFGGLFSFLNVFKLDHFLQNVEARGFMRYQVDLDGRSSKWLASYMTLRMGEVYNRDKSPGNRDNLFFRSNRVDTNSPLTDWYRTLRANKFEEQVFEKRNIKFVSVVTEGPHGTLIPRPGYIQVSDKRLPFNPTPKEFEAIASGDPNKLRELDLKGRFKDFIEVKYFNSDKEGRQYFRRILKEETRWWQVTKRRHVRLSIQNMTGTRSWRFFEKTRDKVKINQMVMRNKLIEKAIPEDTKSGKVLRCFFGSCPSSSDPANPVNKASLEGSSGGSRITDGKEEKGKKIEFGSEFTKKIVSKVFGFGSMAETVNAFIKIDEAINNGSLTKLVVAARGAQAAGMYTTYSIARDQLKTGEVNSQEVDAFMKMSANLGKNDAWDGPLSGYQNTSSLLSNASVYAQSTDSSNEKLEPNAVDAQEYCTEDYQEKIKQNKVNPNQYAYKCPDKTIGNAGAAGWITDWWKNGPIGKLVHPILSVVNTGGIFSGVVDFLGGIISVPANFALNSFLNITGLKDDQEKLMETLAEKVTNQLGAGPMTDTSTPSNIDGILAAEGGTYIGEASLRFAGAAKTNASTRALAEKKIASYYAENGSNQNFREKYLSLENPHSLLSNQLYAATSYSNISGVSSIFSSFVKSFGKIPSILTSPVSAARQADDGYSASKYAGIQTFDFPDCPDPFDMTPQNATNADELGVIPPEELTWDLITDQSAWYERLSGADDDTALKVYNCGLLDETVRDGLGALKGGYEGKNVYKSSPSNTTDGTGSEDESEGSGTLVTGESRELAQQILDSGRVVGDSRYMSQIQAVADGNGSCHINPTILQIIATLAQQYTLDISSLNRYCTGKITDSGEGSYHYRERGGHAVDFQKVNGNASTGGSSSDISLLNYIVPSLPSGSSIGQVGCRARGSIKNLPAGVTEIADTCNHIHIQVPPR